jgi:drug/metabolite transporter (DMT)-like permease
MFPYIKCNLKLPLKRIYSLSKLIIVSVQTKAIISMLFVMLIWGSSFAVTKSAIATIPPITFAFLRFVVASICLHIMLLFNKRETGQQGQIPFAPLFWLGFTGVGLFYIFFNYSLVYTSASMGALIQAFIPVIIAVLAFFFLKEKITKLQIFSILISVSGVALVSFLSKADQSSKDPLLGNTLMIIAVIAWGIYTIISKKLADKDILKVTCYSTDIGTLLLIPFVIIELWHKPFPIVGFEGWVSVIYLGALASAIAYYLYNQSLKNLPASVVGVFINLDPIIGTVIAMVFLKEKISLLQVIGSLLVLTGMWLSTQGEMKLVKAQHKDASREVT